MVLFFSPLYKWLWMLCSDYCSQTLFYEVRSIVVYVYDIYMKFHVSFSIVVLYIEALNSLQ